MFLLILFIILIGLVVFFTKGSGQMASSANTKSSSSDYISKLIVGVAHDQPAQCPYCGIELKKHPAGKGKCKSCGQYMFKRTRPSDKKPVTVTESDAHLIDIEWQKIAGVYEDIQKEKEEELLIAADLKKNMGTEPSKNQVKWKVLEKAVKASIKERHAGGFGNARFDMGELLVAENKKLEALDMFLEDAIVQLNLLVHNYTADPSLQKYLDKPTFTSVASGLSARINEIVEELKISNSELKAKFKSASNRVGKHFKPYFSADDELEEFERQTGFR